jgi:DNA-binding transcriptional ArsR family regulator
MKKLEQVRVLAHPLRLRLLEAFAVAPRTTRQVAKLLGVHPTRLYHHVNALERVGLVRLRETRPVRGTVEKYFEAVGRRLAVEPGMFDPRRAGPRKAAAARAGAADIAAQLLDLTRGELLDALERAGRTPALLKPVAVRMTVRGSPARIASVRRRLVRFIDELQATGKSGAAGRRGGDASGRATLTMVFVGEVPNVK